ncbi:hypothetical protein CR513_25329, partial [Mucuna pruriens]
MFRWLGLEKEVIEPMYGVYLEILGEFPRALKTKVKIDYKLLYDLLRVCVLEQCGSWNTLLPLVEFIYNNNYHSIIRMTPYEALYGQRCRTPLCWFESDENLVLGLEESYHDKIHKDLKFKERDHVFLKVTLWTRVDKTLKFHKLSPPLLPILANLHNVFHVSQLHKYVFYPSHLIKLDDVQVGDNLSYEVLSVRIEDLTIKTSSEDATWELESHRRALYPEMFTLGEVKNNKRALQGPNYKWTTRRGVTWCTCVGRNHSVRIWVSSTKSQEGETLEKTFEDWGKDSEERELHLGVDNLSKWESETSDENSGDFDSSSSSPDELSAHPKEAQPETPLTWPTPSRPSNAEQPNWRNGPMKSEVQFNSHVISWSSLQRKVGTKKPKVAGGDRLEHQHTLEDSILSVLATRGEPSSSAMAIVVNGGATEAKSLCLYFVSINAKSSTDPLYAFDPEIEKTLRRLRRTRNLIVNNSRSSDSAIDSDQFCTDNSVASSNVFTRPGQMENHDKTLKELATPDMTYELKSGLIHLWPKFHGLTREDPHKHLKEFHVVCSTMRPQGIPEDYIKMKAFPFSLDGAPALFNTWGDMKHTFLEKFFPASRTATIRKEICGIWQHTGETLHEYWERFNKLYATCSHHQISEQLLIQYFYEGLSIMDKSMIDAASG